MTANNSRYDLSDRLIHFFRSVDPSNGDAPVLPEHWGFAAIDVMDDPLSPFFLLRNAIRQGRLWATWSERGGNRTIYGPNPAVCFTEMPIAAFVEAGLARSQRGEAMSPYGLVFPKPAMFALGVRPVIYALSGDVSVNRRADGARIIDQAQLPLAEQYRYVTYDPTGSRPIDWTHEREWRWPLRDAPPLGGDLPPDIEDLHGLDFDDAALSGLGVIVKTQRQAEQTVHDILTKVDRGDIHERRYDFVLALEAIDDNADLRDREAFEAAIDAARIDLSSFFSIRAPRARALVDEFKTIVGEVEDSAGPSEDGELGGCWLWITDTAHEVTRALLRLGEITVTRVGKYIVQLREFSDDRSLRQREAMTLELARRLQERLGLSATYFAVLGHEDPDGVPFYNGDELDNRNFYNFSNDPDDY